MKNPEVDILKDKVNDNNWSCLVVLLIETDPNSMDAIDLFEKHVPSRQKTDIQILTPKDLTPIVSKEKVTIKDVSPSEISKAKKGNSETEELIRHPNPKKQALEIKNHIMKFKVNDLKKRAKNIRYLINNEINSPDSDSPEPDYGAFSYFVLTKFYDPYLIICLMEINVPLVALFELRVEGDYRRKSYLSNSPTFSEEKKQRQEMINYFWESFLGQVDNPEYMDYFSECLFLPIEINVEQWNGKNKGDIMYELVLLRLFSINNKMRRYIHCITNSEVIDAPEIFQEIDMDIYNMLIDSVPLECTSVELILHCIVEQVAAHFEGNSIESYIQNLENIIEIKEIKFPLFFINHRDKIRRKTFHLKNYNLFNPSDISAYLQSLMPYATFWKNFPRLAPVEKALNANQIKKFLTCATEEITEDKFIILLHLMSFNKLLSANSYSISLETNTLSPVQQLQTFVSILDKDKISRSMDGDSISSESTSDIPTKRQMHLNTLKTFLGCDEFESLVAIDFQNELLEFCYTEELPKETLLQISNKAYYNFLCTDCHYSPSTDSLLLWFHNVCDENGLYTEIQEGVLNAMIGFGDFCTHPDNETDEWLSNQEKEIATVDEALKKSYISRNFPDINPISFVLNPSVKVKIPFPIRKYMTKQSKKEPYSKVFNSFGSSRIKVLEQTDMYFSVDGPSLLFKKTRWLRKEGYITITLNSDSHLLTFHQPLLNTYAPTVIDPKKEINFNIESNKGFIVSTSLKSDFKVSSYIENDILQLGSIEENEAHYETLITLPNGLVIELFRGKYNYIKQTFLKKNNIEDHNLKQEDYRIFLKNGTIIVFMNDGSIVLLYSNSTEARIKVVGKKPNKYNFSNETEKSKSDSLKETEELAFEIIRYEIIGWNGKFLRYNRDDLILDEPVYKLKAAFSSTRGLFTARSDGTKCYTDRNGILSVSFSDKTVTTVIPTIETIVPDPIDFNSRSSRVFEENRDEESLEIINNSYIMDHPYYAKVEFTSEQWIVNLPFGGKITATTKGFELHFDKYTNFNFSDELVTVISKKLTDESKNTLTKIYLKGLEAFEYTMCSVQSSDGKVFSVSNIGDTLLTTVQKITESEREEAIKIPEQITFKKKLKFHDSIQKPTNRQNSLLPQKDLSVSAKYFKKQFLLYTKTKLHIENDVDQRNTSKTISIFSNTKLGHRFLVVNRDLSGYEFINEGDVKASLKKYKTNFEVFQSFLPCITITNDMSICQMPLTKTWSQMFLTEDCNWRQYNTNLKQNELLNIPIEQRWLCIKAKIPRSSQNIKHTYENKPIFDNISLQYPAMLIRRLRNIKTKFSVFKMFKSAIKQFNKLNFEILSKYEKNLLPVTKLQSDIDKSDMIFRNAMEELMNSRGSVIVVAETIKGDSISSTSSPESNIKLAASEDSDESDIETLRDSLSQTDM